MSIESYKPGLENVIACETSISYLDVEHEEIVIRGYDLIDLARQLSYVDVIGLLLYGRLPSPDERVTIEQMLSEQAHLPEGIYAILSSLPASTHPMDALRTGVSALSGFDPELADASVEANRRRAFRLLALVPQIVANSYHIARGEGVVQPRSDLSFVANSLYMITKREPSAAEERYYNQVLMVYCEHELPNSTFAARVIASTQSDMYGALTGAVASLKGPLHGGANEAVMNMLLEAQTVEGFERLVRTKLANREKIMGFGHRVYMRKSDPRALLMKEALREMSEASGDDRLYRMCLAGEEIVREEKGLFPNLDYYAAPVMHLLGIPVELFTPVFFAARVVGLAAHVTEQLEHNRLFRPRVLYTGPRGYRVSQIIADN
ncbi:citrate synthase [Alicyclobacillus hesperidum subsp. aegles]|uniref:citrate synthase n=1 Tax=Alicyclobacillus hesperidum TaxID=89784 RepID=UPI0007193526|nr:citrate synthase [Alicyclobacillus hesperidum]KRW90790.1 citrate synthase 3 [Alicyclobacillus tengchongensis]GLG01697.1 citrate synthase [Alicyclobacillus hesperidum subsp. aegles]